MVFTWEKKERKTSKFIDQRNKWNERGGNKLNEKDRKGSTDKKTKFLGTERCENIYIYKHY